MKASGQCLWINRPGVSATVQDAGRKGYRQQGLACGGAMDRHAFHWANRLLDNPPNAACLEIMLGGFEATAETDMTIALTGAEADVSVDGHYVGHWQTLALKAGDKLAISHARSGRILYLALPGGIDSPVWFGSQSVVPREHIEGLAPLTADTRLRAKQPNHGNRNASAQRKTPANSRPGYDSELILRLIPGYQRHQFSKNDLLRLTTRDYEITQQSDRMGFRLNGPALQDVPPGIISEGIAVGALQVPGDGQPIALMNDCQTIGGYPKPGVIAAMDLYQLAQCLPGQTVRFEFCDIEDAQNDLRLFNRYFQRIDWNSSGKEWFWK